MLVLLTMMLILLFMGAFMDWVGIVLLIIPVFLPIVQNCRSRKSASSEQLSPSQVAIWFGVVFCMNMQVSFLSPPFGPAAFYLKSVAPPHISLTDIFRGFLPFIGVQLLALSVLLIWPSIVTILLWEGACHGGIGPGEDRRAASTAGGCRADGRSKMCWTRDMSFWDGRPATGIRYMKR